MSDAQTILKQFCQDYKAEGERVAVENAAPWLEAHPGEMEQLDDPDAAALLWAYYGWEGDEDTAWEWRDKAEDAQSPLMEQMLYGYAEEEVEEDDWEQEFEAFDDETEAGE